MALSAVIYKQPYEIVFSGSPVIFGFALSGYTDAEKSLDIHLSVTIKVETIANSGSFTDARQQSFYPNNKGTIDFNIQTILHPYLEYYTPRFSLMKPTLATGQQKRFKISYLLIKNNIPVGSTQETSTYFVIKGGIAYQEWHPSEFFSTYLVNNHPPLSFFNPVENVRLGDKRFLSWLYPYADSLPQTIIFSITHNLSFTPVTYTLPDTLTVTKWSVCMVPVGYNLYSLQALLPAGAVCISYTVKVLRGSTIIVAPVTYSIDQRNFYDTSEMLFRNSLGGLETITLRGQVDMEADYSMQQAQRTVSPSWYTNMVLQAQTIDSSPEESLKFKGDTGFISRDTCDKLRDLFLSEVKYEVVLDRLIPITFNAKNVKFFGNKDNLISLALEWQLAFVNSFYTPAGLMPQSRTCPTLDSLSVTQLTKTQLQVIYAAPSPYDRVEVEIINGIDVQSFIYTKNSDSVSQVFVNPGNVTVTWRGRVVCNADIIPADFGPWTTGSLAVLANSIPVVTDTTFSLAPGFSTPQLLIGNVLINANDPDGDAIETVAASGATAAGGSYSISTAGVVNYTPPTVGYSGNDTFVYLVREVGGATTIPGTATIAVAIGSALAVYAKVVETDQQVQVYDYGTGPSSYHDTQYTAIRWAYFFSDAACTLPLDVTTLSLNVNVRKVSATTGGTSTEDGNFDSVVHPIGFFCRISFDSVDLVKQVKIHSIFGTPASTLTFTRMHTILPGTGYTPI